jgi:glycosyltransferase involved in cell wall biosynthesis
LKFQDKCSVVYNAFERSSVNHENISNDLTLLIDDYGGKIKILIPSSLGIHKNLKNACHAAGEINVKYKDVLFILIGNWTSLPPDFPVSESLIPLGYVSDSAKNFLYSNCDIVLVPSIYEGFGIPYIEAMSNNKLLVASDIPICREIASDYPFFIQEPFDTLSIRIALESAIDFFISNEIRLCPDMNKFSNKSMASNYLLEIINEVQND